MSDGDSLSFAADRFNAARDHYCDARNEQRKLIAQRLECAGFTVRRRGRAGRGLTTYTSGGRLFPPYDLSNWMWVSAQRDNVGVTVKLQTPDQDPNSQKIHALIDRISLEVYEVGEHANERGSATERTPTSIQLPMSDESIAELLRLIEQMITELSANGDSLHLD